MMVRDQYAGELPITAFQIFDYRLFIAKINNADLQAVSLAAGPNVIICKGGNRVDSTNHRDGIDSKVT
jgi:hypothetical protein